MHKSGAKVSAQSDDTRTEHMQDTIGIAALAASIIATGLGVLAARVHVRNSQDHFIADLHRQSRWAGLAAAMAAISAGLQAAERFMP
jgi:hypothetical protein